MYSYGVCLASRPSVSEVSGQRLSPTAAREIKRALSWASRVQVESNNDCRVKEAQPFAKPTSDTERLLAEIARSCEEVRLPLGIPRESANSSCGSGPCSSRIIAITIQ